jgi:N-acetylneuraminic acid mutarotase
LPPRRSGALGVVHEAKLYIFGGYDGRDGNYFNDLFFFDLGELLFCRLFNIVPEFIVITLSETRMWSEMPSRPTQRPQARTDHIMVLHQSDIYVFGGYDGHVRYNNLHKYSIQDRNWSLIQPNGQLPSRRFGHSGATYTNQGKLILFGGWDGRDTLNDLHSYDFEEQEWTQLRATGAKPSHRYRHTAVIYQDSMFIFGGVDKEHSRFNDLQRLDLSM